MNCSVEHSFYWNFLNGIMITVVLLLIFIFLYIMRKIKYLGELKKMLSGSGFLSDYTQLFCNQSFAYQNPLFEIVLTRNILESV